MEIKHEDRNEFIKKLYPGNPDAPLYAIAVARETHDDTDYPKLKPVEKALVFNTLSFILNQKDKLPQLFEEHINNKKKLLDI